MATQPYGAYRGTTTFVGTSSEYRDFCFTGRQFSKDLSAYVAARLNVKLRNRLLEFITVYVPHLYILCILVALTTNLIPSESAGIFLGLFALYVIFEIIAVAYIAREMTRVQNEGIAHLRSTQKHKVDHLRNLARKEYPEEGAD